MSIVLEKPEGRLIQSARKAVKLSQTALASAIGVDQSTISDIENGKIVSRQATVISIAKVLQTDFGLDWLSPHLNGETNGNSASEKGKEDLSVEELISLKFGIGEPKKLSATRKKELIELAKYLDRKIELELELEKQDDGSK